MDCGIGTLGFGVRCRSCARRNTWRSKGYTPIVKNCPTCKVDFSPPSQRSRKKNESRVYCSRECRPPWNKGKTGLPTWNKGLTGIYSDETRIAMGEKNVGRVMPLDVRARISTALTKGNTPIFDAIRKCFRYRIWHAEIMRRDNYICQNCGERGGKLEVDHYPLMFSEIVKSKEISDVNQAINSEELWDTENGRTLCVDCHKKVGRRIPVLA